MPRRRGRLLAFAMVILCTVLLGAAGAAYAVGDSPLDTMHETGENVSSPVAPPDFDSTERLVLTDPEPTRAEGGVSVDPTVATSTSFARLEAEYNRIGLDGALDEADGSEEEVAVVDTELDRLERQIGDELALQQETYTTFHTGDIDGDAFLREMSMNHLRATVIFEELEILSNALRDVTAPVTQDDAQQLRGEVSQAQLELETLRGSVTERGAAAITAEEAPLSNVSIQASSTGYVMATVDNDVYVREAVTSENRQRGSGAGFTDIDEARSLTAEWYPWTIAESLESEDVPRGEIFASTIDHPHGTTTVYIDGETERPFRDGHELDLFTIPTEPAHEESYDDVRITVDRTYAGGPTHLRVIDTAEDDPIAETAVRIDGDPIGQTDLDGSHWFVAPDSDFELGVELEDREVTIDVRLPG